MNWTTIMVGLDDLKAKIKMFYPKKIVLDTIRGDAFLYIYIYIYIYLLNLVTSLVLVVTIFFLSFSPILFPQGVLSILYYLLSFISTLHV